MVPGVSVTALAKITVLVFVKGFVVTFSITGAMVVSLLLNSTNLDICHDEVKISLTIIKVKMVD